MAVRGSRGRAGSSMVSMQKVRLSATAARSNTEVVRRSHEAGKGVTGVVRATTRGLSMVVAAGMVKMGPGSSTTRVEVVHGH